MSIDRGEAGGDAPATNAGRTLVVSVVLGAALALASVPAVRHLREQPPAPPPAVRLTLALPDDVSLGAGTDHPFGLALAPDGRSVVFPGTRAGEATLWIRNLTTGETASLPGTDGGTLPFWKPDGSRVGFFAQGRLKALDTDDGTVRDLADAPAGRGGAWHPSGDILFAPAADGGLWWRRSADGRLEPFTALEPEEGETTHRLPVFVPGGDAVVFFVGARRAARQGAWIAPTGAPEARRRLVGGDARGLAAGGYLIHANDDALVAQALDLEGLALTGRPVVLGLPVGRGPLNQLFATVSDTGLLVYGAPGDTKRELTWVGRDGVANGTVGGPADSWDVRIAPDGASVAVTQLDRQLATLDVWVYEGVRPIPRRVSAAVGPDEGAIWSPDAARLAWASVRQSVVWRDAQATRPEQTLGRFDVPARPWSWTPDGASIVAGLLDPETRWDLWTFAAHGDADPVAYAASPFNEVQAAVSPDGRWLAYASDDSGTYEIYLDTFPRPGTRRRLTLGGGSDPRWRADGRELYFRRGTAIHALAVRTSGTVAEPGQTLRLFDGGPDLRAYDAAPDGRRFLLNQPAASAAPRTMAAIVNWRGLIK